MHGLANDRLLEFTKGSVDCKVSVAEIWMNVPHVKITSSAPSVLFNLLIFTYMMTKRC
jgi:hypothetical protein